MARTGASELTKIRRMLMAVLLLMIFAVAFFAKALLLPIVLGMLLALTVSPLVRGAARVGIPSGVTATVLIFGMAFAMLTFLFMMGDTLRGWMTDLPDIGDELREKLATVSESVEAVQEASKEVEDMTSGGEPAQRVVVERPALLATAVSNLAGFATSLGVGMVLALFLLASGDLFYAKLVQTMPRLQDKKRALKIVYAVERQISHYLLAITAINACLGASIALAMYLVGMPYPLLWGLLAFALNFVPFIGAVVGAALAAVVAVLTFDTLGYAVVAPMAYLALTTLEGQFLTPLMVGHRLQLNTVSVFLTVIFWAWLWGIPGALLAVPALVVLKVIAENFESMSALSNFLSGRSVQDSDEG